MARRLGRGGSADAVRVAESVCEKLAADDGKGADGGTKKWWWWG